MAGFPKWLKMSAAVIDVFDGLFHFAVSWSPLGENEIAGMERVEAIMITSNYCEVKYRQLIF